MSAAESGLIRAIAQDVAKLVMEELRAELRKPAAVQKLLYDINEAAIIRHAFPTRQKRNLVLPGLR